MRMSRKHMASMHKATQIKLLVSQARPPRFFLPAWAFFISHSEAFPVKVVSTKSGGYQVRGQFT